MFDRHIPGVLRFHAPKADLVPVIFDSPHSGSLFPPDFGAVVPKARLREAEDAFVNDLYGVAPAHGAVFLEALFPRTYIDPNRAEHDMDPDTIDGTWSKPLTPGPKSSKVGSGLIWRTCHPNTAMYDRKMTVAEVKNRIETYYRPYREALREAIDAVHSKFGQVWHVNCHSMPAISSDKSPEGRSGIERPEFILGDRSGKTCETDFTTFVGDELKRLGHQVVLNDPYNGGDLVVAYSNPTKGRHSLQIEIKRSLYMDETLTVPNGGFDGLQRNLTKLVAAICAYAQRRVRNA